MIGRSINRSGGRVVPTMLLGACAKGGHPATHGAVLLGGTLCLDWLAAGLAAATSADFGTRLRSCLDHRRNAGSPRLPRAYVRAPLILVAIIKVEPTATPAAGGLCARVDHTDVRLELAPQPGVGRRAAVPPLTFLLAQLSEQWLPKSRNRLPPLLPFAVKASARQRPYLKMFDTSWMRAAATPAGAGAELRRGALNGVTHHARRNP